MIRGRSDDMFKVRGVNMFPSQIEDLLQNVDGVASEYTVTLAHDDEKEPRYHDSNCRGGGTRQL